MPDVQHIETTNHGFDPRLDLSPEEWHEEETAPAPAPKAPSTPAPAAQTPPAPEPVNHPRHLVLWARRLGYAESEISAKGTDALRTQLEEDERALVAERSRFYGTPSAPRPAAPSAPAGAASTPPASPRTPAPAPAPAPTPAAPVVEDDLLAGVNLDDFDPALASVIKRLADAVKAPGGKLKEVEERVGKLFEAEQSRQQQAFASEFEGLLAKHPHVYGAKPFENAQDSPEAIRIRTIHTELERLVQSGKQTTLKGDFDAIHAALFGGFAAPAPVVPAVASGETSSVAAAYVPNGQNGHVNGTANGHAPESAPTQGRPRDPKTGQYLSNEEIEEQKRRDAAWMAAATPAPTARRAEDLPPGEDRAAINLAKRMRARGISAEPS